MTIPCSLYPLGTMIGPYNIQEIICDVSNGGTAELTLNPGVYYVRAQGAGGSGGNNSYWSNGGGGGSGAGFEGNIKIKKTTVINVTTPVKPTASKQNGGDTIISGIMTLGGGKAGGNGAFGPGGTLTINDNLDVFEVVSSTISSDGLPGNGGVNVGSDYAAGANSVLTGDGGGKASADYNERNATKPGAGAGGGTQWSSTGGLGMYGECLIKFVGFY